jgi:hypothetical protein
MWLVFLSAANDPCQAEVIEAYARERNLTVVRTYADRDLSGLSKTS